MIFFDESLLENIKNMDNNREIEKTLQYLILQIEIFVLMSYILYIIFNGKSNQKNEFFNQEEIERYFFKKLVCQQNISLANEELFFFFIDIDRYKDDEFIYKIYQNYFMFKISLNNQKNNIFLFNILINIY